MTDAMLKNPAVCGEKKDKKKSDKNKKIESDKEKK